VKLGVLCFHCYIFPSHTSPPGTLPYLFQALFVLDDGLAPLILKLIYSALSGTPPAKEEGSNPEAEPSSRSHTSRSSRRKELEEHKKAKEKGKEAKTVVVVGEYGEGRTVVMVRKEAKTVVVVGEYGEGRTVVVVREEGGKDCCEDAVSRDCSRMDRGSICRREGKDL
jgi:hypothetical protein